VLQLLVTAYIAPRSLILSNLMMDALRSSETSVLTTAKRRHIPEDGIHWEEKWSATECMKG
jgi:hypothetical protein